jgi:hypothetical protein
MSKAVQRRGRVLEIRKLLNEKKYDIGVESDILVGDAEEAVKLDKAKQYYASCRIQGIVRGFLARFIAQDKMARYRAGQLLQRIMRGKLGRLRWMREYWKSISVVKSPEALVELIKRSSMKREITGGSHWQEYYDPVSGAFWYVWPTYSTARSARETYWASCVMSCRPHHCPCSLTR